MQWSCKSPRCCTENTLTCSVTYSLPIIINRNGWNWKIKKKKTNIIFFIYVLHVSFPCFNELTLPSSRYDRAERLTECYLYLQEGFYERLKSTVLFYKYLNGHKGFQFSSFSLTISAMKERKQSWPNGSSSLTCSTQHQMQEENKSLKI